MLTTTQAVVQFFLYYYQDDNRILTKLIHHYSYNMQSYLVWHRLAVILSILALLTITYTSFLINNFKTPEATANFFQNSDVYYYVAEIVKANIRTRYPAQLRSNVIQLTAADAALNAVVTPNLIERLSLPALRARQKIAQLPLYFSENNLILDTIPYTQQLSNTLASFNLPTPLNDAGKNLIASIPPEITVVDTQKNPNSILASITQTRIFFENLQLVKNIAWLVLIVSVIIIILANMRILRRLVSGFMWVFVVSGIILLLLSYVAPATANALAYNPDPTTGVLKDQLVDSMVSYYFSLTRTASIVYLLIALGLYLVYRFVPFPKVQEWTNEEILPHEENRRPTPARASSRKRATKRTRKR